MNDSTAAIVSGDHKALVAEVCHYINLVLRHGTEGIINVVRAVPGFAGIAVATKIRDNHRRAFRKAGGAILYQVT